MVVNSVNNMYDINKVRADFPILSREVYKKPLVYLDNAATTQKPLCVLDALSHSSGEWAGSAMHMRRF